MATLTLSVAIPESVTFPLHPPGLLILTTGGMLSRLTVVEVVAEFPATSNALPWIVCEPPDKVYVSGVTQPPPSILISEEAHPDSASVHPTEMLMVTSGGPDMFSDTLGAVKSFCQLADPLLDSPSPSTPVQDVVPEPSGSGFEHPFEQLNPGLEQVIVTFVPSGSLALTFTSAPLRHHPPAPVPHDVATLRLGR